MVISNPEWYHQLETEFQQPYYVSMWHILDQLYEEEAIFPPKKDVFTAFELTPFDKVKVVVIGQDPYHGKGQAHGLSFSVNVGNKLPPSLKNIFKELEADTGITSPDHGCLSSWAEQGVLLINTVLTVKEGEPSSHKDLGWHQFTDKVITKLNQRNQPMVFILWGNFAIQKIGLINNPIHKVIQSSHPSPFSARKGFFGSQPFSKVNTLLVEMGYEPIDWSIDSNQQLLDL